MRRCTKGYSRVLTEHHQVERLIAIAAPSYTHARTHDRDARARTNAQTHTRTRTRTKTHAQTHTHTHTHARARTHTHAHLRPHTRARTRTRTINSSTVHGERARHAPPRANARRVRRCTGAAALVARCAQRVLTRYSRGTHGVLTCARRPLCAAGLAGTRTGEGERGSLPHPAARACACVSVRASVCARAPPRERLHVHARASGRVRAGVGASSTSALSACFLRSSRSRKLASASGVLPTDKAKADAPTQVPREGGRRTTRDRSRAHVQAAAAAARRGADLLLPAPFALSPRLTYISVHSSTRFRMLPPKSPARARVRVERLHNARCVLPVARCMLHVARCVLHVACCTLRVACCTLRVACCTLPVEHDTFQVAGCTLLMALRTWHDACCALHYARWRLHGAHRMLLSNACWHK
jgi:hypothetical protein